MKKIILCLSLLSFISIVKADFISGLGSSETTLTIASVDKWRVKKLLPKEFILNDQDITEKGKYPILINFNHQQNVSLGLANSSTRLIKSYGEIIIAIPFVSIKGKKSLGQFSYLPTLLLDNNLAIGMGKAYGLNKTWSDIKIDKDNYIAFKNDSFMISNKVKSVTNYNLEEYNEGLENLNRILKMPLINIRSFLFSRKMVCADFNWNLLSSYNEPIEQRIKLGSKFFKDYGIKEIKGTVLKSNLLNGSLRLTTDWEISTPYNCETGRVDFPGPIF